MWFINFIIAVCALIVAISAYQRTGARGDEKDLFSSIRENVGEAFSKMGKALRKEEPKQGTTEEEKKKSDFPDIESNF